jgi:hypothetical protein
MKHCKDLGLQNLGLSKKYTNWLHLGANMGGNIN